MRIGHDFQELRCSSVCTVIVFHTRFHVFQLIEYGEHVDKLAKRKEICFGYEIFPFLGVTQTLHFNRKCFDCLSLKCKSKLMNQNERIFHSKYEPHLEIHEVEQFIDFGSKYFDSFLIYFHSVRLLIRLRLWNSSGTASPSIQHHSMLLAFIQ